MSCYFEPFRSSGLNLDDDVHDHTCKLCVFGTI
jgi:hypothetical protein